MKCNVFRTAKLEIEKYIKFLMVEKCSMIRTDYIDTYFDDMFLRVVKCSIIRTIKRVDLCCRCS